MSEQDSMAGQVAFLVGDRRDCMERFISSFDPSDDFVAAVDDAGRPVALVAIPKGCRGPDGPWMTELFLGGALKDVIELHRRHAGHG